MISVGKLVKKLSLNKDVIINMEQKKIEGSVLDIGTENYGVIYNLCKWNDDSIIIEYIDDNNRKKNLSEQLYDNAVMFFALENVNFNMSKRSLINEVANYLKDGGKLLIWDYEKANFGTANLHVKVILPGNTIKKFNVRNLNFLKKCSVEDVKRFLQNNFDIINYDINNSIYHIEAVKKGRTKDESITDSD